MFRYLFYVPLLLIAENLEVVLPTRSNVKPLYISPFSPDLEELRSVLAFDLNTNGFSTVAEREEKVPYRIEAISTNGKIEVTLVDVLKSSAKKYPPMPQTRKSMHQIADAIQKDLFGKEGIASQRLIYTQRTKTGTEKGHRWISEVWVCDSDGQNAHQVTEEKSYCLSPRFVSNKKDEFIYVSEKNGQSKIYRGSLSSPVGEMIMDLRGNQMLADLTKKGNQIAFITDLAGRPDLFVQDLDPRGKGIGKPRQLFSAPRATQATPTYSPDGKQLAFVSDKDGPPRIYVLSTNGTGKPRLVTQRNRENTSPAWSPDGTKLAYSAKVDGVRQIWIYDFIKEEETLLTRGPQNKENPSWAPDSFHLVYNTETEDTSELYLVHLNEGEPIQISRGEGQKRFASWESR